MAEQIGRSESGSSTGCGDSSGGSAPGSQGSFAEVTVIDSQFQHFSGYIEVLRVFKCRLCTFCSPLEHVIASHMSEVHFPRRCFLCKQCLFVFEDRAQLASHLDSAHGTKSIAVCFGDTAVPSSYPSSPPASLRMMMGTAEGEERIQQQMMEETTGEETRNGRVTSSTGNLANLANATHSSPPQVDSMEHTAAELGVAQGEGGTCRVSKPPSIAGDTRQEQVQSHSSSCHPSSSNQANSSPEIIDCEAVITRPGQPEAPPTQRPPSLSASQAPSSELRVTIGNTYCQSYIKTEPISPVRSTQPQPGQKARPYLGRSRHDPRSYMRRWSLTENSLSEDGAVNTPFRMSRSFDTPGSGSALQDGSVEEDKTNSERNSIAQKIPKATPGSADSEHGPRQKEGNSEISRPVEDTNDKEGRGKPVEKSKSFDTGKTSESHNLLGVNRSYISGRSLDRRPPRLVRQNVVEESPRSSPQLRVVSEDKSTSQEQNEISTVSIPCGAAEAMRRENFSRSFSGGIGRPSGEYLSNSKSSEGNADFRPTLRDLVSSRMQRVERQLPPSTTGSGQDPGLPVSSVAVPMMRSGRVRSYSISEGDMQGYQKSTHPDGSPIKAADGHAEASATETVHPSAVHHRLPPGNPQVPPVLHHHQYPGLVYQPYSIEGEPKHMRYYNQGPRMAGPGPLDGPPRPFRMRQEENGQPGPNQPVEESFLYRYLRNNNGRKYRRNSISVSTLSCDVPPAGLMPSHGIPPRGMVPHPEGAEMMSFERQRASAWVPRHHPDHPFQHQGPFPSHMPPYPMAWKDKFDASQISPNASAGVDQRHGVEYSGPSDRDPAARGEMVNGPNGIVLIDGKVVRPKQGEGGESNQDLAKDITRQVHEAMGVAQGLYTPGDRHLLPWVEGNDRSESPDDPMDGEGLGQRRSRKSTFNIYREIPERKRKLDHDEEEKIKHSYNADGSFDYFSLTGWKAYKCDLCKKRRFKTASELQEHKQRKHGLQRNHSSQGSLNGLPEAAAALTVVEANEPNDSPSSG
ncbi:uncharacterized protein LOC119745171 [Patiria miniata]|uniref:C2H2-type domain-containing protein n=1 Tax=Patiria miniata TaxID=46514 RepID=A0A914BNP1_PATMI|nr:uncharacterized protein LOC119745171 [Patiria miniata]